MPSEIQVAVAGSGKTQEIARRIDSLSTGTQSLALTYTTNGQAEISSRLSGQLRGGHETMGWFAFLVRHIVAPYLPALFPDSKIYASGLCFVQSDAEVPRNRAGWRYYFNDHSQPYSSRLSVLAKKVLEASSGAPITRLEVIYDNIYIDEFQDLRGNDLWVLEALMRSSIDLFITGDVRQSVLATSASDRLNSAYRGVELVNWVRKMERNGVCVMTESNETGRFNQSIASFSDMIHDPSLALPATTSRMPEVSGHDGVFLVDEKDILTYAEIHGEGAMTLWSKRSNKTIPKGEVLTFGTAKGLTRDRVIILTTTPIVKLLKTRTALATMSAAGFYVAATRARYSIALIAPGAERVHLQLHEDFQGLISLWRPDLED